MENKPAHIRRLLTLALSVLSRWVFNRLASACYLVNRKKPSVLFFSDSRGFRIGSWYSWKNGFGNPIAVYLLRNFKTKFFINKYRHTTFYDLMTDFSVEELNRFDYVILILGVVDYSPRDIDTVRNLRNLKGIKSKVKFLQEFPNSYGHYEGKDTNILATIDSENEVLKYLNSVCSEVFMIESSAVDDQWLGTYWRTRPKNINKMFELERNFHQRVKHESFRFERVDHPKTYTVDNIHYNSAGFGLIRGFLEMRMKGDREESS